MTMHKDSSQVSTRAAGIVIALSAIVSIVAVALDKTPSGSGALAIMKSMIEIQQSHQVIHMIAMTCLGGLMFGFTTFSQHLGLQRAPVRAGLIAYGFGTMLMLLATVIDGFISTDIALMFVDKSPEAVQAGFWMIDAMGVVLVDIAKVAWVFQSVAVLFWASALLFEAGFKRAIGVVGLVAGALPAITVFMVGSNMTDQSVVGILVFQAVWNLAAATLLLRGAVTSPRSHGGQAAVAAA